MLVEVETLARHTGGGGGAGLARHLFFAGLFLRGLCLASVGERRLSAVSPYL